MLKRWLGVCVLVVMVLVSASQLSSAQDVPPRPVRDRDAGQLAIDRAPDRVGIDAPHPLSQAAPLHINAVADWSKLTYQSYIGNWDIFAANGDGTNATRRHSALGYQSPLDFERTVTMS